MIHYSKNTLTIAENISIDGYMSITSEKAGKESGKILQRNKNLNLFMENCTLNLFLKGIRR